MNNESAKPEWHYIIGMEIRGPVSLEQLASLLSAGTITESVLVSAKDSAGWRPAGEVLDELRAGRTARTGSPPLAGRPAASEKSKSLLDQIGETLNLVAGTEKLEGFSLQEMFSETFRERTVDELEEYLIVGTYRTTPKISEVETGWPKPWLFMRFLLLLAVIYFGFVLAFQQFHNANLI